MRTEVSRINIWDLEERNNTIIKALSNDAESYVMILLLNGNRTCFASGTILVIVIKKRGGIRVEIIAYDCMIS